MRTTSLMLVFIAAGCTGEPEPLGVAYAGQCPPAVCGLNSPEVARNGMHEAHLFGQPDENGISLETSFSPKYDSPRAQIWDLAGRSYDLSVHDGRITGRAANGLALSGTGLIGAELHVLQHGQPLYTIRIDNVRTIITPVGKPDPIEVYAMTWMPDGAAKGADLCEVPARPFDDIRDQDQLLGMLSNEVLVYEGDRIDATAKTMSRNDGWDDRWFNFGCAGRTLAKLRLLRKTQGNGSGNWAARQTALKMLAADYCGVGVPFTRTGTRIGWKDAEGLVDYVQPPHKLEARWNENGATCLDTPRMIHAVPSIADYIREVCKPLPCYDTDLSQMDPQNLEHEQIVSALYD